MALTADQLQTMWDKQEITELVYRLSRGVDRADEELIRSCYWPEAHDDHGAYKGDVEGLVTHLRRRTLRPDVGPLQHAISNVLLEVDGDIAYGESYSEARAIQEDRSVTRALARYVDRFERRENQWRIIDRVVILESARPGFDVTDFVSGARDRTDPSYRRA